MRTLPLRLAVLVVALAAVLVVAAEAARAARPAPAWLRQAERQTLAASFGRAVPLRTDLVWYRRKVAVVWTFGRVVRCGICSAPSTAMQPRGRVIRVSFDRATHELGGAADGWAIGFCEVRGAFPPRRDCLNR